MQWLYLLLEAGSFTQLLIPCSLGLAHTKMTRLYKHVYKKLAINNLVSRLQHGDKLVSLHKFVTRLLQPGDKLVSLHKFVTRLLQPGDKLHGIFAQVCDKLSQDPI